MSLGADYLRIVLRLRKLVPGWVESYAGRADLVDAVDSEADACADGLRESVQNLMERVRREGTEPARTRWLDGQLCAISTALLWLGGQRLDYATLFERCHGASVALVPDRGFERAHALLDDALPGRGGVAVRYQAWRKTQLVPRARLRAGLELLASEMRHRCRELFRLPDDEGVTWELVSGKPWAANAEYLGQRRTLIKINVDLPISSARLLELVCHEAYPGHHSEGVCKDVSLIESAGREELSAYVYPTPQALISEGLASYALEALLDNEADQVAADCLRPAGIPYDYETAAAVREADELLLPVRSNIALMLDSGTTSSEAHAYAREWLLDDPEQIDEAIEHLEARAWRPYESCYPVGLALCRQYAAGDRKRFTTLLHQQLIPADLAQ